MKNKILIMFLCCFALGVEGMLKKEKTEYSGIPSNSGQSNLWKFSEPIALNGLPEKLRKQFNLNENSIRVLSPKTILDGLKNNWKSLNIEYFNLLTERNTDRLKFLVEKFLYSQNFASVLYTGEEGILLNLKSETNGEKRYSNKYYEAVYRKDGTCLWQLRKNKEKKPNIVELLQEHEISNKDKKKCINHLMEIIGQYMENQIFYNLMIVVMAANENYKLTHPNHVLNFQKKNDNYMKESIAIFTKGKGGNFNLIDEKNFLSIGLNIGKQQDMKYLTLPQWTNVNAKLGKYGLAKSYLKIPPAFSQFCWLLYTFLELETNVPEEISTEYLDSKFTKCLLFPDFEKNGEDIFHKSCKVGEEEKNWHLDGRNFWLDESTIMQVAGIGLKNGVLYFNPFSDFCMSRSLKMVPSWSCQLFDKSTPKHMKEKLNHPTAESLQVLDWLYETYGIK